MKAPLALLSVWLLAALAAPPAQPPGAERGEAAQRNEARTRPARATEDNDEGRAPAAAAPAAAPEHPQAAPEDTEKDDEHQEAQQRAARLSLTASQQQAVGIRTDAPLPLATAPAIEAYATVLDPVVLVTDAGRSESTHAAALAAEADVARQEGLYRDGAQASLKTLQAARAQAAEADAQAQAAGLAFRQQWGPVAVLSGAQRNALLERLEHGHLLLRADVPGQRLGGAVASRALLDVEGVQIDAQVLGALPRTDAQSQSAGWLLEVARAPAGLGAGARVLAHLQSATAHGLLVPAAALIYAEQGAYVYRQLQGERSDTHAYESVPVKPLARVGAGWLVEGLGRSDQVVVQGAGVLWSLQGIAGFSAAEEEHD
jgi:hypothetical protein